MVQDLVQRVKRLLDEGEVESPVRRVVIAVQWQDGSEGQVRCFAGRIEERVRAVCRLILPRFRGGEGLKSVSVRWLDGTEGRVYCEAKDETEVSASAWMIVPVGPIDRSSAAIAILLDANVPAVYHANELSSEDTVP